MAGGTFIVAIVTHIHATLIALQMYIIHTYITYYNTYRTLKNKGPCKGIHACVQYSVRSPIYRECKVCPNYPTHAKEVHYRIHV